MKTARKKLGVWMDHSMAHLMEICTDTFEVQTIESESQNQDEKLQADEKQLQQKERRLQRKYYKKIGQSIKDFYHVVLFGPADAKHELFDMMASDGKFRKIKIEIKETDKMTPKQQQAFLRKYFSSV